MVGKFGEEPWGWHTLVGREGYGIGSCKAIKGGREAFKAMGSFTSVDPYRNFFFFFLSLLFSFR